MNIAFYTAVSGMTAYQQDMDVLAHNMANVNTIGFKPLKSSFSDLLYTQMDTNVEGNHMTGHGVRVATTDLLFGQGALEQTDNEMDFAIVGQGFFRVERGDHDEYTRNGAFKISVERGRAYLTTSDGGYVLDERGRYIDLDYFAESNVVDVEGIKDRIGIYTFSNPYGLIPTDGGSFLESTLSGPARSAARDADALPNELVQGALERSGVDLGTQMVDVIQTQRAFQINARIVQTADEIEEVINNLR